MLRGRYAVPGTDSVGWYQAAVSVVPGAPRAPSRCVGSEAGARSCARSAAKVRRFGPALVPAG
eukprot:1303010-Rhodomonas_salina.3